MRRIAALSLASLVVACSLEPEPLPVRFETEHFRYHAAPDRWICPGLAEWLEHHHAAHAGWLSVMPAGKIDYHYLHDLSEVRAACGEPHGAVPSGCVQGSSVYSWQAFHAHELIHAYTNALGGPPPFFREGIAVLLGGGAGGAIDRTLDVESFVEASAYRAVMEPEFAQTYGAAGALTRFLVDRHGRDAYLGFYAAMPEDASGQQIRGAFESAFGESLEEALEAWRAGPDVTEADIRFYLAECATPALAGPIAQIATLSCDTLGAVGSLSAIRSFSITERTGMVVGMRASRVSSARIEACTGGLRPARVLSTFEEADLGTTRELWTDLAAGDYWLYVVADGQGEEESADASVSIERRAPLLADACGAAAERAISADVSEVVFVGSLEGASDDSPVDGLADLSSRLLVSELRHAQSTKFSPSDLDQATLCIAGCPGDAAASCLEKVGGAELAPGVTHTLTFAGTAGEHGFEYGLQLVP